VVGLKPRDALSGLLAETPVARALKDRQAAVERAEEARLFYVACTRAEQRLILCLTEAGRQGSWAGWVRELAAADPAAATLDAAELPPARAEAARPPAAAWPGWLPPGPGPEAEAGERVAARALGRPALDPQRRLVRESVSGLENWLACPRLYLLTRRWGLDTGALGRLRPAQGQDTEAGGPDPVALGSAAHRLLELADLSQGPAGLDPALLAAAGEPLELAGPAAELARGVWRTGLGGLLRAAPPQAVFREQPFRLWLPAADGLPELEVMGEVDLLIDTGGRPVIADYKVSPRVEPDKYRDQLTIYALAVERGLAREQSPPQALLCFLWQGGAELVDLELAAADLAACRERIRRAAGEIAGLGPETRLAELPAGDCGHCPAAGLGLCGEAAERG
jgi:ATP-dependent helicase/nuclease subunit A